MEQMVNTMQEKNEGSEEMCHLAALPREGVQPLLASYLLNDRETDDEFKKRCEEFWKKPKNSSDEYNIKGGIIKHVTIKNDARTPTSSNDLLVYYPAGSMEGRYIKDSPYFCSVGFQQLITISEDQSTIVQIEEYPRTWNGSLILEYYVDVKSLKVSQTNITGIINGLPSAIALSHDGKKLAIIKENKENSSSELWLKKYGEQEADNMQDVSFEGLTNIQNIAFNKQKTAVLINNPHGNYMYVLDENKHEILSRKKTLRNYLRERLVCKNLS